MLLHGVNVTETLTATQLAEKGFTAGVIYSAQDGKRYKLYQYDTGVGGITAVSGNAAYFYAPSGTSAGAVTVVTSDLTDSNEVGAGILQSAPGDGEYGWVQISGPATMADTLVSGADGDPLTPTGAADGRLTVINATVATSPVCAFAIDASAKIIMCAFPH